MTQNLNKGNIYQAAKNANLNENQMKQINSLSDMYSTHVKLNNLPVSVAQYQFGQLSTDQQESMASFFGGDDTTPQRGLIGQAFYIVSRPVVEPIKAVFKAAEWASDQVNRIYRTGSIMVQEKKNFIDAWRRSGLDGETVFNPEKFQKILNTYGYDYATVGQKIAAGMPQEKVIATAENENQKAIAFKFGREGEDKLINEVVGKINAAKYSYGRDIANLYLPEEMEGTSKAYTYLSGYLDAAFRIILDPTLILGKARKLYLVTKYALGKTTGTEQKVAKALENKNISAFWNDFANTSKSLDDARIAGDETAVNESIVRLRRLNPALIDNDVHNELIRFAKDEMQGKIDLNTVQRFLENPEKIEAVYRGQPAYKVKIVPILTPFRKAKIDALTKTDRIFNLNKDSTEFLRNAVFDEAEIRGISGLQAAKESIMGRPGETAVEAGIRTAERIKKATEEIDKFSIANLNRRLDNFSRKFATMPDMKYLGDHTSAKGAVAFERYARLVYGRSASRILGDIYRNPTTTLGEKENMFIGLQATIGELRGIRGVPGGRALFNSFGAVGREAQYTNRVFDETNPNGYIPSQIDGIDSAAYPFQLSTRQKFITPNELDKFAARDGYLGKLWGLQYKKAADDAVGIFTTGTLAGPRFPIRNAIEDYIAYLANGNNIIQSAVNVYRGYKTTAKVRQATNLQYGTVQRLAKPKDQAKYKQMFDDIDNGIAKRDEEGKIIERVEMTARQKEEAKRKVLAQILLRDKFNDAQVGKFGNDFDKFLYEFSMYGNWENMLTSASEGAYNFNSGTDFFAISNKMSKKYGKIVDFTFDGEDYAKQYSSFVDLTPTSQEGKIAWAFQIAVKANDELGQVGMKALAKYGDNQQKVISEISAYIDSEDFTKLKNDFIRYSKGDYNSTAHAAVIYKDLKALFGKYDGSLNKEFLGRIVKKDAQGNLFFDLDNLNSAAFPTKLEDLPRAITGPRLIPATQSQNIISDLNTRLWDWLGYANARLSRDNIVTDAAFSIRQDLQSYLDDLTKKVGKEEATRRIVQLSEELAVERVLAFVDNPAVRSQMAWSMRNFARFYRATEDAYRRLYRTWRYNPEALRKIALTYEGVTHSGFVQRDDQGEAYFIYPGVAPVYNAMNKALSAFGLGDKFVTPMPLQFGSQIKMLTPSANPDSWMPTFSGPIAGLTMKTVYGIAGFFQDSQIPVLNKVAKEVKLTEQYTLGSIGEGQSFIQSLLPGHVNRLLAVMNQDERDSQYASAYRKAVTYLEAAGMTPSADATPGELVEYQKRLKTTIVSILGVRFIAGFFTPASPTVSLKSDMADWVRKNDRVNFKQVFSNLINEYSNQPDPVGRAMADWVKYYPDQIPYMVNESDPIFQANFKTSNAAANWVESNKALVDKYPEGAAFLIPQAGTFSWEAYQYLKDNGYRTNKLVGDFTKEIFVARDKQYYYTERDDYEKTLANASSDSERTKLRELWSNWSSEYLKTRPLLREDFASAAVNRPKREAAYADLKRMLSETNVNTKAANAIRQMIVIYENYIVQKDTVYNSRSEQDSKYRDMLRESTITQLEDIAATDSNAREAYYTLFSNFLRG
jgi:hypothetical protein